MTEVAQIVPFSAWEQSVFVVLFIVLVIGLLYWFTKQSDKWQAFMLEIDEKWRAFNREQRTDNNCHMEDVNKSISNLTKVTEGLVMEVKEMRADSRQFAVDLHDHDLQAKEILTAVRPKPRVPKL